jgi:hypothetical protein
MSLHSSFFFLGQALGPIAYRYGLASIGLVGTNALSAVAMLLVGFMCARYLRRGRPGEVKT